MSVVATFTLPNDVFLQVMALELEADDVFRNSKSIHREFVHRKYTLVNEAMLAEV